MRQPQEADYSINALLKEQKNTLDHYNEQKEFENSEDDNDVYLMMEVA